MKKMIMAAIAAGSMFAMAEEAAKPAVDAAAPVVEAGKAVKARRAQLTPEQRAEMRAKREKFMAERRAAMEVKALEIIKKYGLDDEKAKALFNELQDAMRLRRMRPNMKRPAPAKAE